MRDPLRLSQLWWKRLLRRLGIGHRAAFLMGFGAIFGVIGLGVILSPVPPDPNLFHTNLPEWVRVALWSTSGALAFAASQAGRYQWVGFVALTPPPLERMLSYGLGVFDALSPGPPVPYPYLNGLALYALLLFVITLASSWPDSPTDPKPRRWFSPPHSARGRRAA